MSPPDHPADPGVNGGTADAYLAVVGKKQGALKGECQTPGHVDEITVLTWGWGMTAPTAVGTTRATGRRVHEPLVVTKHLDSASTRLMNALATNEELKSVTLGLRKAGMDTEDFFTIALTVARVSSLHIESDISGALHEVVKFAYQKIEISYHTQQRGGGRGGSQVFSDELSTAA